MTLRPRVVLTLLVALSLFAFPAAAAAEVTVNSTLDEPDAVAGGACKSAGGSCTLRAAIEVTNLAGTAEDIFFLFPVFDGQISDTIFLTSPLPPIKAPVTINSGTCPTAASVLGPCAGVTGPGGGFGLSVEADGVTISNLSITGALTGINVINKSEDFTARNNWIGVRLDGTAGANNTGIFIDPESDGATIGGETGAGNVIAGNNSEGLDIQGASEATIRGNLFGVGPNGTTQMANAVNIEITDSTSGPGSKAVGNEIGRELGSEPAATPSCDGGCNVISGALSHGIDLSGAGGGANEAPASGPTLVAGNHIGLDFSGVAALPNAQRGIWVGGADEVTVGGALPDYGNNINGGAIGVLAGKTADHLVVENNEIGFDTVGDPLAPPSEGINVSSEEVLTSGGEARILGNAIDGTGIGITQHSVGALIAGNEIVNPGIGIYTYGSVAPHGNLIGDNVIVSAAQQGMLIENDDNLIVANKILESGEAGIRIQRFFTLGANGNQVGGDEAEEENVIAFSGGPAIEIESFENTNNEVARNNGSQNAGPFIELISTEPGTEPNGPNEGVKPPVFSTATPSKAEGTAEPGATVRVFRKAGAEPGELASFLGEAVADGSGNWKVSYGSAVPAGTIVAATQTNTNGGTSELATATSIADPVSGGGGVACPDAGGSCPPPVVIQDPKPPNTKIVKGPAGKTKKTTVAFKFRAVGSVSRFECKLDKGKFKKCRSPKKYKKLKPGKHVFKVRAVGPTGRVDPTPAKRKFTVLG